jgi:hypothetical protein
MPAARLERIEKNLMAVAQQIQTINKKLETMAKTSRPEPSYMISRSKNSGYRWWLWIATSAALALLAATGFLLLTRPRIIAQTPQISRQPQQEVARERSRVVAPPDITSASQDCDYVVEKGDSLEKIAVKKKVDIDSILRWNPLLKRTTGLKVGERINLCEK